MGEILFYFIFSKWVLAKIDVFFTANFASEKSCRGQSSFAWFVAVFFSKEDTRERERFSLAFGC